MLLNYPGVHAKPKGEKDAGSVEQTYRYPVETWSEAEARKHCQDHDGTFEAATKQEGDKMVQDENPVSSPHAKVERQILDEILKRREGYEDADILIAKVKALVSELRVT